MDVKFCKNLIANLSKITIFFILKNIQNIMFDNKLFEDWLNKEATKAMQKITSGKAITSNEKIFLALKAQANYIADMRQNLCGE